MKQKKLSLSEKFSPTLATRLRDPDWRRYGKTLLAGKMLGIGLLVVAFVEHRQHPWPVRPDAAGRRPPGQGSPEGGPQGRRRQEGRSEAGRRAGPGARPLRGGQGRRHRQPDQHGLDAGRRVPRLRHAGRLHDAGGRLLPLARNRQRADGVHRRHLPLRPALLRLRLRVHVQPRQRLHRLATSTGSSCRTRRRPTRATGVAFLAFWLFQFAFADTCSTITSGAMIGRTGFVGDLLYSVGVSGFIYPIIGHWAWGPDGFLATMGSDGQLPAVARHELPRLRRLDGRPHHRRLHRPGRRHRARPAPGPQVQARRRRPHAAARPDDRRLRRPAPLVRLVRLQPRQHALRDGLRGHRPRRRQHHARGLRGRA